MNSLTDLRELVQIHTRLMASFKAKTLTIGSDELFLDAHVDGIL
jgi:hypothetical protein